MTFKELNIDPQILKAVEESGYETPTDIQQKAIPKILSGLDICASAQTGTGKTASFLLPALQRLIIPASSKTQGPRILILVPTRELAMQVAKEAMKYSKYVPRARTVCIYGGAPYPLQNRQLSRPYEILVATPGRLIDHLERGRIDLSGIEMLILDEADRMLDMGFIKPVEKIAASTPKTRQTLMFSATLRGNVMKLSKALLNKPIEINAVADFSKHDNIEQRLHFLNSTEDKYQALDHLLHELVSDQIIVFTSTKRQADSLLSILLDNEIQAAALHGDMDQRRRTRTINQLRQGEIRVLVATDVAARGIDVQTISHVINFDLPNNPEDYVHRIGRTGRAGAKGVALSFATHKDIRFIKQIEKFTGQTFVSNDIPGYESIPEQNKPKRHNKKHRPRRHSSPQTRY